MDYKEYIQSIISTRGQWSEEVIENFEAHHILPISKGGEPKRYRGGKHPNIIWLKPEEHYMAHKLLALENLEDRQLVSAWGCMHRYHKNENIDITEEEYTVLKTKLSENLTGENNPMYGKSGNKSPSFGIHRSPEERKRQSERMTAWLKTHVHPSLGKHLSEETKKKLSEKRKEYYLTHDGSGENNPMYGKKLSEESKKQISLHSAGGNNPMAKKVMCIETQKVYSTLKEAAIDIGKTTATAANNISKCCQGKRETFGDYHWKYID